MPPGDLIARCKPNRSPDPARSKQRQTIWSAWPNRLVFRRIIRLRQRAAQKKRYQLQNCLYIPCSPML